MEFDRQIIAQALAESIPVVTPDEKFSLVSPNPEPGYPWPMLEQNDLGDLCAFLNANPEERQK